MLSVERFGIFHAGIVLPCILGFEVDIAHVGVVEVVEGRQAEDVFVEQAYEPLLLQERLRTEEYRGCPMIRLRADSPLACLVLYKRP